jgi:hypothetical protein
MGRGAPGLPMRDDSFSQTPKQANKRFPTAPGGSSGPRGSGGGGLYSTGITREVEEESQSE